MGIWRFLAKLAIYLDHDGDGDVDHHDFLDGDHDGASDVIGVLLVIIKVLSMALCVLAWNAIRVHWKLKQHKMKRRRELLIFACSPRAAALPNAVVEATEVSRVFDASIYARGEVTANELRAALLAVPTRRFLFIGHTDAPMLSGDALAALAVARHGRSPPPVVFGCRTLGFVTSSGHLSAVAAGDLAQLLGRHGVDRGGELELVFLNGCRSESLARAVVEAGVPLCVCWKTKAHDGAARLFSRAFFDALAHISRRRDGAFFKHRRKSTLERCLVGYVQAFREAVDSVRFETTRGTLANGVAADVPKYEIRDPSDPPGNTSRQACAPQPVAAGIPWIVASRRVPLDRLNVDPGEDSCLAPLFLSLVNCARPKPLYLADDDGEDDVDDDRRGKRPTRCPSAQAIVRSFGSAAANRSETHLPR